jgi:hypothetical protein
MPTVRVPLSLIYCTSLSPEADVLPAAADAETAAPSAEDAAALSDDDAAALPADDAAALSADDAADVLPHPAMPITIAAARRQLIIFLFFIISSSLRAACFSDAGVCFSEFTLYQAKTREL